VAATWLTSEEILAKADDATLESYVLEGGEPKAAWLEIIEIAKAMMGQTAWGAYLSSGHWMMAAHLAFLRYDPATATGAVTSRRVDKIQESYAVNTTPGEEELMLTKYGRMYVNLRRRLTATCSFGDPARGWDLGSGRVL